MPFNGIALRVDLHRLFDARLFTFGENGDVEITAPKSRLCSANRRLLRNKRLPPATLSLPQFLER